MLNKLKNMALILLLGGSGGVFSAISVIRSGWLPERIQIGQWFHYSTLSTRAPDPYTRAFLADQGQIPLDFAEGISLYALQDANAEPLTGSCTYLISGIVPLARAWTISILSPDGGNLEAALNSSFPTPQGTWRRSGMSSAEMIMHKKEAIEKNNQEDKKWEHAFFQVGLAATVQSGNWLPILAEERFMVALTLYDPITHTSAHHIPADSLPKIERVRCS
jgi:hypothetical protein